MSCEEFQQILPELEDNYSPEQERHLKSCAHCSALVAEVNAISRNALLLVQDEDPSPRVWNRIEIALRQEGLIRDPQPAPSPVRTVHWSPAWLIPLAASFLLIFGLLLYQRGGIEPQTAQVLPATSHLVTASLPEGVSADQAELLNMVAVEEPSLRAAYESEFKAVNAYIRDAESAVRRNPNDQISQQYLTNAYEQRAMVYEMAMDHGLQ
jgi:anti-sigma factor RsiW